VDVVEGVQYLLDLGWDTNKVACYW